MRRLIRYMARPPISHERLKYDSKTGQAHVFSTKKWMGRRKHVATYDAFEFLALLSLQVPPRGTHMVRYFGAYSVRGRARRRCPKDASSEDIVSSDLNEVDSPSIRVRKKRWAQLIRHVFEVDPLTCTSCGAKMKVLAFITTSQKTVLDRILDHLHIDRTQIKATGPPAWVQAAQNVDFGPEDQVYLIDPIYEEPAWIHT